MSFEFKFPYEISSKYSKKVVYLCMEFGIDQPLKTYAGGLGFLAGSHLRSAYSLKQNFVGVGILWKYGYYTQTRKADQTMDVLFEEKRYGFLQPTDIKFTILVSGHQVSVTAYYLAPEVFKTAPVFFLSTDLPENDYLARTISHKLYDSNPETKIAAAVLLGEGSAKLMEALHWEPDVYHLNESHALPIAFYLYQQFKDVEEVKQRLVFTNHTPESAGNQKSNITFLEKMGFFCGLPQAEIKGITQHEQDILDHTLTALRLSGKANGVSKLHRQKLCDEWSEKNKVCSIHSVTNSQNYEYWHDEELYQALRKNDTDSLRSIKQKRKHLLFDIVADQCGEIYNPEICTIVFAKRFSGYKRADLFFHDTERFVKLITNKEKPVQFIWAGKPYPVDYDNIGIFDKIVDFCKTYPNCAILTGYEMRLSKLLKAGADVWLNAPRITHEASGTSGMSAAMNGAINVAIPDGWFPEFAKDKLNAFVVPPADSTQPEHLQDDLDAASLLNILEKEVLPVYYDFPKRWNEMVAASMNDIIPYFDSDRMAHEYYEILYA